MVSRILRATSIVSLIAAGCVSSLPDDPLEIPDEEVIGLAPIYLSETDARWLAFTEGLFDEDFRPLDTFYLLDSFALAIDTLVGVYSGDVDSILGFRAERLLRAPGITTLSVDSSGGVTFNNAGDLILGRLDARDSFTLVGRFTGQAPLPPPHPFGQDLWRAPRRTRPGAFSNEAYFECYDSSQGLLGGWEEATLTDPPCLTHVFR